MSRHFNYELDERRVKLLLQENSMSFSEDVWNDFLQKTKPIEKVSKLPSFKINLAINRSVILTAVFLILIGSFTLLIAKFVDFSSTKSNTKNVREVKPDPSNYKIAAAIPVKKTIAKPTVTLAPVTNTLATSIPSMAIPTSTTQYIARQTNTYAARSQTYASSSSEGSILGRNTPDSAILNTGKKDSTITQMPTNTQPRYRKKKKKEAEVLETKPLTTELPLPTTEEPELELK